MLCSFQSTKVHRQRLLLKSHPIAQSTNGGDEEDRTPDPLRARQVLSQLSYTPMSFSTYIIIHSVSNFVNTFSRVFSKNKVLKIKQPLIFQGCMEHNGIEPLTSCVQGRRSPSWANAPLPYLNFK